MHRFPQPEQSKVVILEPSVLFKQILIDILKNLRYTEVQAFGDSTDFLSYLEEATPDWILLPAEPDMGTNFLQILKLITLTPSLQNTRISVFITENRHEAFLAKGFELGLLSWHYRTFEKENVEAICDFNMYGS